MLTSGVESKVLSPYTTLAVAKSTAGIGVPSITRALNRASGFFMGEACPHLFVIMVGRAGEPQGSPGSLVTGYANPVRLTTPLEIGVSGGELLKPSQEDAVMATAPNQTHPKFLCCFFRDKQSLIVGLVYPTISNLTNNTPASNHQERDEHRHTLKNDLSMLVVFGYSERALAKSSARIETLNQLLATHDAPCVFFCVCACAHPLNSILRRFKSMVALAGQPKGWLVSFSTSSANPVSVTTPIEICTSGGDSLDKEKEIIK